MRLPSSAQDHAGVITRRCIQSYASKRFLVKVSGKNLNSLRLRAGAASLDKSSTKDAYNFPGIAYSADCRDQVHPFK